jgi:hypothetical protein
MTIRFGISIFLTRIGENRCFSEFAIASPFLCGSCGPCERKNFESFY